MPRVYGRSLASIIGRNTDAADGLRCPTGGDPAFGRLGFFPVARPALAHQARVVRPGPRRVYPAGARTISMRRFWLRFSGESFGAIGWY